MQNQDLNPMKGQCYSKKENWKCKNIWKTTIESLKILWKASPESNVCASVEFKVCFAAVSWFIGKITLAGVVESSSCTRKTTTILCFWLLIFSAPLFPAHTHSTDEFGKWEGKLKLCRANLSVIKALNKIGREENLVFLSNSKGGIDKIYSNTIF